MKRFKKLRAALISAALFTAMTAGAQETDTLKGIEAYRAALQDGNPAELWEMRGEEFWKTPRGPKKASLERCDLGKGAGVVKGAYVELPRYFADADKVMDLEQRLVHCMVTQQGLTVEEITKRPFGSGSKTSDMEGLVAFITGQSRGMLMNVQPKHPKEQLAYEQGRNIFFYRAGPHDFSCATCHAEDGKRIRLQELPNLLNPKDAQRAYGSWPAYRVSQGEVRTMQHRLWDCFRQQRFPEPAYASDALTSLTMFLAKNANGGTYDAPALKR